MLCNLSSFSLFALALSSVVSSRPVVNRSYGVPAPITPRASVPVTLGGKRIGSNQQGGRFDDFYGNGNFDGNLNQVTIIKQQKQLVCSSNDLRQVRQQLAVIQEFAKQIILQQVCEVEIQTVIIQQLNAQIDNFGRNVRRSGGRNGGRNEGPSFDVVIAQKITEITQVISRGGNVGDLDLGFLGSEVGRNSARVGGSNWNDDNSPESVGNAYKAAKNEQDKENNKEDEDEKKQQEADEKKKQQEADEKKQQQEEDEKKQQEQKTTTAETATQTATEAATETATEAATETATEAATETATEAATATESAAASTSSATAEATAESSAEASATSAEASTTEATAAATESSAAATPAPTNARK